MEVTDDVLGTIQLMTSKLSVVFRLSILDQEKEILSKTGTGQVIIPLFRFLANKGEHTGSLVMKVQCYCFYVQYLTFI